MNFGLKLHDFRQRCQKSVLFRRLAGGAFWSLIAVISINLANILTGIILAHILGKLVYGQYGMLRTTLNMFILFSSFSLGATATKYVAEYRVKDQNKVGRIIGLSLISVSLLAVIFFLICYFSADFLAIKSLNSMDMAPYLKIGAWMILFAVLNSVLTGILSGFESFSHIAKTNITGGILLIVSSITGAKMWGLKGALVALSLYLAGMLLTSIYFLSKNLKFHNIFIHYKDSLKELPILWKFSLPATMGGFLVSSVLWISSTMLIKSSAGYDGMAGLEVINQWKMAILFLPSVVCRTILPMLSNLNGLGRDNDYLKVIRFNLFFNIGIALCIAIFISLFSRRILIWYGENFIEYTYPFVIVMIATIFCSANSVIGAIILSKGHAWYGFFFNLLWGITFLIFCYYFVSYHQLGVSGISYAYLISYILHTIWQYSYLMYFCLRKKKAVVPC